MIDNYPSGVTTQMINERYAEPRGPFNVEVKLCSCTGWDLWNLRELESYQEAIEEAQYLTDHGIEDWQIIDSKGNQYKPNLKRRK